MAETNEQRLSETKAMDRLLHVLGHPTPIYEWAQSEKPDFFSEKDDIGCEVTVITPNEYVQILNSKLPPDRSLTRHSVAHILAYRGKDQTVKYPEFVQNNQNIKSVIRSTHLDRLVSGQISKSIQTKEIKSRKYRQFAKNWLLLSDPLPYYFCDPDQVAKSVFNNVVEVKFFSSVYWLTNDRDLRDVVYTFDFKKRILIE